MPGPFRPLVCLEMAFDAHIFHPHLSQLELSQTLRNVCALGAKCSSVLQRYVHLTRLFCHSRIAYSHWAGGVVSSFPYPYFNL